MHDPYIYRLALLPLLLLALPCSSNARPYADVEYAYEHVFNVLNYGAVGDGQTDDTIAFERAWKATCSDKESPSLYVPRGYNFLLQHLELNGPCASPSVHVQISGTLVAPSQLKRWTCGCQDEWIKFERVENLRINGRGKIFGNGAIWWDKDNLQQFLPGCDRPTSVRFHACDNLELSELVFLDSPKNHISISGSTGGDISKLHIIAPEDSPNTDGIDISHVSDLHIHNSIIETGDDCFALNGGCARINITNVKCGPGHGISIGSLGKNGAEDCVEDILVRNCTLQRTQNGVRIKTWQGGRGYARRITFDDIKIYDSYNPIIIDQAYCDHTTCHPGSTAVKISDITYSNIRGTSKHMKAISLMCSDIGNGCGNIVMKHVNLELGYQEMDKDLAYATCSNAHGIASNVFPEVSCLKKLNAFW
ncbi:unnamed protein product [Rhodiola kirilowii]